MFVERKFSCEFEPKHRGTHMKISKSCTVSLCNMFELYTGSPHNTNDDPRNRMKLLCNANQQV